MSSWCEFDDPLSLLQQAAVDPWQGDIGDRYTASAVDWQPVDSTAQWNHEVAWCNRPGGGAIAIHRFSPHPGQEASMRASLDEISALARQEMEAHARRGGDAGGDDSASNVGGFHGERDLFERHATQRSSLPTLIGGAVQQAAQAEATALGRAPIPTTPDEAWFNVLRAGGYNKLHTHPGSTYSGVMYVSAGSAAGTSRFAGRLALVPHANAVASPPDHQRVHLKPTSNAAVAEGNDDSRGNPKRQRLAASGDAEAGATKDGCLPGLAHTKYLLIDPVPGRYLLISQPSTC